MQSKRYKLLVWNVIFSHFGICAGFYLQIHALHACSKFHTCLPRSQWSGNCTTVIFPTHGTGVSYTLGTVCNVSCKESLVNPTAIVQTRTCVLMQMFMSHWRAVNIVSIKPVATNILLKWLTMLAVNYCYPHSQAQSSVCCPSHGAKLLLLKTLEMNQEAKHQTRTYKSLVVRNLMTLCWTYVHAKCAGGSTCCVKFVVDHATIQLWVRKWVHKIEVRMCLDAWLCICKN